MKKIKVCFVIPEFFYSGGIERVLSKWSTNFPKEVEHTIVTLFDKDFVNNGNKEMNWENNASKIINMDFKWQGNFITKRKKIYQMANKIDNLSKEEKFDFVISCGYLANDVVMKTKEKHKKFLSLRVKEEANLKRRLQYRSFKKADKIISVSEELAQLFSKEFKIPRKKIEVIQNAIDLISNKPVKTKFNLEKFNLVTIGRLEEQKNHLLMIKAMKEVIKEKRDIILHIFGDGEYKTVYETMICEYGLEKNVILHGAVKNVVEQSKGADLFVLTSKREGFANVLLEASKAELPIITTYCQTGVLEYLNPVDVYEEPNNVIDGQYGIILPSYKNKNIIKIFATQILRLEKDRELLKKYKEKSSKRVSEFNIQKSINKWLEILSC